MHTVNATAAALLGLLRAAPLSGYDLVQTAQEALGDFWTVTRSQVYRELAAMADRGLVVAGETGPRDRRPYSITAAGQEAFRTWLHEEPGSNVVRIPLLLRLAFADDLDAERLRALVANRRSEHEAKLAHYLGLERDLLAGGAQPRQLLTLRFGIRYEQAALAWFDEVEALV